NNFAKNSLGCNREDILFEGPPVILPPGDEQSTLQTNIVVQLRKRFPPEDFLEALDVVDPQQYKSARHYNFSQSASLAWLYKLEDYLESLIWISSTKIDALTLRTEHGEVLIQRWRNHQERRFAGKGDSLRTSQAGPPNSAQSR